MCGIVGYTGAKQCIPILIEGLEALSYRGYDSAGVAVCDGARIALRKEQGKLSHLEASLCSAPIAGTCGIGHTRWATHGEPNLVNAHPHTDTNKTLALVHNGIIENYQRLKELLLERGCTFVSDTDTEVVAQLIGNLYRGDPLAALREAVQMLEGSFALAILFRDDPQTLYCACKDSPMVVGHGDCGAFVASDIPALLAYTRTVAFLDDRELAILRPDGITCYDAYGKQIQKPFVTVDWDMEAAKKGNFEHFMLKEIFEQPVAFRKTVEQYASFAEGRLKSDCFPFSEKEANELKRLRIVSCGTAYHAGLLGKKFIEHLCKLPVTVEIASEFRYGDLLMEDGEPLMVISQSGETADTIAAMRLAKRSGKRTVAICNVIGSTIARECDQVLFTYAGPEIAVAATKSYLTQITVLYLFALDLAQKRGMLDDAAVQAAIAALGELPRAMQSVLDKKERIQFFASRAFTAKHVFFIGRGLDQALSMEAALKLKEISYIHSEAYAAGELKHGTIALIEDGVLAVAIATQPDLIAKMASNMEEVRVRGAQVLALTNGEIDLSGHCHEQWTLPAVPPILAPFVAIIPMQLLAYYMAVQKGCSVDQPRNLAKSVTVE